jgi:hypothetical protein
MLLSTAIHGYPWKLFLYSDARITMKEFWCRKAFTGKVQYVTLPLQEMLYRKTFTRRGRYATLIGTGNAMQEIHYR